MDVLKDYVSKTDIMGQMQGNIERMEREGTIGDPALDEASLENAGKTQYQIDQEILTQAISERNQIIADNPKILAPANRRV